LVLSSTYPRWSGDPEPGFVHELCRRIVNDFEIHVLCPHAPEAKFSQILDGIHVHRFRYAPQAFEILVQGGGILNNLKYHPWKWLLVPSFIIGMLWVSARLVRQLKPRALHIHWILPQGLFLLLPHLLLKQRPSILLTSHGGDLFALRGRLLTWLKRLIIHRADAITVVSRPMLQTAIDLGACKAKLVVIPMGANFGTLFVPGKNTQRNPGEILFVGRLVEKKGLKHLVAALPRILQRVPNAFVTIAGYGPDEALLRNQAATSGLGHKIHFLGATPQEQLPHLYRRASAFVAPFVRANSGDQEGLPVALMEAIACNCPVVAGDLEVLRDLFEEDFASVCVDAKDSEALAEKIVVLLTKPDEGVALATRLRTRLESRLSWDTVAAQYSSLLQKLIQRATTGLRSELT